MRWFDKLDAWMVARVYQPVVDLSQLRIGWWGSTCSVVMAIFLAMRFLEVSGWAAIFNGALVICYMVCAVVFLLSDALYADFFSWFVRACVYLDMVFLLILLALTIYLDAAMPWRNLLGGMTFASLYYFSKCAPPRPKQPRRKLVLGGVG